MRLNLTVGNARLAICGSLALFDLGRLSFRKAGSRWLLKWI
ncbi:hypothetical protein ACTMU2_29300 [Cupriavidus basilensis]